MGGWEGSKEAITTKQVSVVGVVNPLEQTNSRRQGYRQVSIKPYLRLDKMILCDFSRKAQYNLEKKIKVVIIEQLYGRIYRQIKMC